ncbi:MAG: HAMP domain-containing sensor histidine kinase [Cyanobacteria bacterium J06554_11]
MHLIASPQPPQQYPTLSAGSPHSLGIHSTLSMLPLYTFTVTGDCAIRDLISHFTQFSKLPGVVVSEAEKMTILSRQQCLDCLLHTSQIQHFIDSPVRILLNQTCSKPLMLDGNTSILNGAKQALKRPYDRQSEPLLICQHEEEYQILDAHTLNVAHWHIRGIETQIRYERLQMQILESEKMAALGRLVDGVAHEILDPVSFIWGNLSYIANYTKQQHELLLAYEKALPDPPEEIVQLREDIEIDYLRSDFPAAIKSARGGAHRLRQLATSLQNFCHIDEVHPRPTDLNTLLDSTLRLLKSRLTTPITVEHSYGKLPPVPCFSGQLSQVFMSIFTSAINALLSQVYTEEMAVGDLSTDGPDLSQRTPLKITVTTCVRADQHTLNSTPDESRWVAIIISDNGPGIPPETKAQIIDSFSTENRYLRETGLAISYQIITAKHGGKFWIRSVHTSETEALDANHPTGTEFEILLPLTTGETDKV